MPQSTSRKRTFDIISIGSSTVDVFCKTDAETIEIKGRNHGTNVDEKLLAYPLGSKILINELDFHIGGGGTNVACTFSRLGLKTGYIGRFGKDEQGRKIFGWLKEHNITFLGQVGGRSGYSVVLDSQADDRTILVFKGSNNEIEWDALPKHDLDARWYYSSSMMDTSYETLKRLFPFAKNKGGKTAFNPSNYMAQQGLAYLEPVIKHTDVLILNKEEAEILVGKGSARELGIRLLEHGPRIVTVSDGARGATITARGNHGKEEQFTIMPAHDLKIVETTGAGDAFGSGFVAGLALGKKLQEAALMGVLNAEGVIQAYGAKEHIPDKAEMDALLKAEQKNPKHKITVL